MLYSKSTNGFYSHEVHGSNIPYDAVEISREKYAELIDGQGCGNRIISDDNGCPSLAEPLPPIPPTREHESLRLRAYADPLTGSDRHFSEAVRHEAMGEPEKAEPARMMGIVRYNEIKEQYPWP